jgi:hypothetical protein
MGLPESYCEINEGYTAHVHPVDIRAETLDGLLRFWKSSKGKVSVPVGKITLDERISPAQRAKLPKDLRRLLKAKSRRKPGKVIPWPVAHIDAESQRNAR